MDRAEIAAIIDKAYAARKAGDVEALVGMFRPDGVFRVDAGPTGSGFRSAQGRAASKAAASAANTAPGLISPAMSLIRARSRLCSE